MTATEIITIVNNSGKIISTGKHLVNIFKDAKATYKERKYALKIEKAEQRTSIQRAKTFDVTPHRTHDHYHDGRDRYYEYDDEYDDHDRGHDRRAIRDASDRRQSQDDDRSHASSRHSHRSRRSHRGEGGPPRTARPLQLTENNLKTHSEVSSVSPSAARSGSKTYRSPYAETAPRDMQLSRPTLTHAATMPHRPAPQSLYTQTTIVPQNPTIPVPLPRSSNSRPPLGPSRSETSLAKKEKKDIDMHLAYGNIPPDLATRVDLDHSSDDEQHELDPSNPEEAKQDEAMSLIGRIEALLDEAHCLQQTAITIISNLQQNPQAAAAVALSLAELTALIGKMSPAFLAALQGASPAIYFLLASPQFMIGTSIAVGVTVVIFGGLKIIKRLVDTNREKEKPFEMRGMPQEPVPVPVPGGGDSATSYDEALVLENVEELSTIETWRRAISEVELKEMEKAIEEEKVEGNLITPIASRMRKAARSNAGRDLRPEDSISQVGPRGYKERSHHRGTHENSRRHSNLREEHVPGSKSSTSKRGERKGSVVESEAIHMSHKGHKSHKSHHQHEHGSSVSKSAKNTKAKIGLRAIEGGGRDDSSDEEEEEGERGSKVDTVIRQREKKRNMLRGMFKGNKKGKEEKERSGSRVAISVLV
ncbi:hypothetical protein B0T17DRAFT_184178 [Bombardia bombarda]|uniref:Uncharacterized protein n=1 Tax=Bombardia bombarda TaxID=252184 RepID=A0AA39X8P0_9PEZI|nr:hypothetical protein B0T17DRAFT_184178 [Bombardia bombarda]